MLLLQPLICFSIDTSFLFPGQPDPHSFIRFLFKDAHHTQFWSQKEGSWTEISKLHNSTCIFPFFCQGINRTLWNRGPQPQFGRWPVRKWATKQELTGKQASKATSVFTVSPHRSPYYLSSGKQAQGSHWLCIMESYIVTSLCTTM